jgi:hypothetical protein
MKGSALMWATAVGGGGFVAVVVALWFLARADHEQDRLRTLQANAAEFARLDARRPAGATSLCKGPLEPAMADFAEQLRTDALASGNEIGGLHLEPEVQGPSVDLARAALTMSLTGDDRSLLGFLKRASERRHPVAVEQFEISLAPAGGLQAELKGYLLCRRSPS